MNDKISVCVECGTPIAADEILCPLCGDAFEDDDGAREARSREARSATSSGLSLPESEAGVALGTLFECWRCHRLVEAQSYRGMLVMPRFCPWCGNPLSSILGRELDGYRLDQEIAAGGFGIIYLASNLAQPSMKSVVKFLRPAMAYHRAELIKIFVEEARLTEEIGQTCWNIVRVSNVREKPWPYFFMEYIRGTTMEDFIEESKPDRLPIEECVGYLRGMAKALAATHGRGRVHRDLKPLNVMVIRSEEVSRPEEKVKLLDFGLAMKIASRRGQARRGGTDVTTEMYSRSSPLQSAGTPEYMAPEAYDGVNDFAGDIYSFGVTAYEILTSVRPWDDPDPHTNRLFYWREAHKKKPPRPLREHRSEVPPWLARVIAECLEKDPRKRNDSAENLVERLRKPTPLWVWLASAAALVLVALLGWRAFTGSYTHDAVTWRVGGNNVGVENVVLWVRSAADLAERDDVYADVPGSDKEILTSSSPIEHVRLQLVEGKVQLQFAAEPSLLGSSVTVEGGGDGFRFRGMLMIGQDPDPPVVGRLQLRLGTDPVREVKPGERLNGAEVSIQVRVDEPHPARSDAVVFYYERRDGERGSLRPSENGEPGSPAFSLQGLGEGRYVGWVVARDQAGNTGLSERTEFTIDLSVGLGPTERWKCWIAGGRGFYQFQLGENEAIRSLSVLDVPTGKRVEHELLPYAAEIKAPVELLPEALPDLLSAGDSVTPESLEPGGVYLLTISLTEPRPSGSLQLQVQDGATPPNEKTWKLAANPEEPLTLEDVTAISLHPAGEDFPRAIAKSGLGRVAVRNFKVEDTVYLQTAVIDRLDIEVVPGRVLRGELEIGGVERSARVENDSLTYDRVELAPDADSDLELRLYDPLENSLRLQLVVHPDTRAPDLEVRSPLGELPRYYAAVEDVELLVEASEPLPEVTAALGTLRIRGVPAPRGGAAFAYRLASFGRLGMRGDGEYRVRVEARDRAGNAAAPEHSTVILDSGPPRIEPLADLDAKGTLQLTQDSCLFTVKDPNGVNAATASCRIEYREDAASSLTVLVVDAVQQKDEVYEVPLKGLPDRCAGRLVLLVSDGQGLRTKPRSGFDFEFTRPEPVWRPEVRWRGVTWILVDTGKKFFISKTEVSNEVFRNKDFFHEGRYREAHVKHPGPKYWGQRGEFPLYRQEDGKLVEGDRFPVVGISYREAEAFGRKVFRARLPTWEEWLLAARLDNPGGRFPWKDQEAGKDWFNYRLGEERPTFAFHGKRATEMILRPGNEAQPVRHVRVDESPFPYRVGEARFARIWHILGNVGELVKREKGYGIAGGNYDSDYQQVGLEREPDPYLEDRKSRTKWTGFRLVILPAEGDPEFLDAAKEAEAR